MTINALPLQAAARNPRGIVKLNGTAVKGWVEFSVDNNSFYSADTFKVTFALHALPADFDANWFSKQKAITTELLGGFPADPSNVQESELEKLITGKTDEIDVDLTTGLVHLHGRDFSSELIDTKTAPMAYKNQTSSQIAEQLAAAHGLTPKVTATTAKVGTYWDQDHVKLTDQRSEWDLLTYLAYQERFIVYVKDKTLYFGPSPFLEAPTDFYVLKWEPPTDAKGSPTFNGKHIEFTRSLTVSKGINVTVTSYDTKHKRNVTSSYPSSPRGIGPGSSTTSSGSGKKTATSTQTYRFKLPPGRSVLELEREAKARYDQIVQHEMKLRAIFPADTKLDIKVAVKVEGTGTAFDQVYYPDAITRTMSLNDGYQCELRAKNHAPDVAPPV